MNARTPKRRCRKATSILLTFAMLFTLAPAAYAADDATTTTSPIFSDVADGAWYKEAVDYSVNNGLLVGVSDDLFGPNLDVSRAMVVTVMWRQSGAPQNDGVSTFKDVAASDWYAQAIKWGQDEGLVAGMADGVFSPKDDVSREQLVTFIQRYAEYTGSNVAVKDESILNAFTDADKVSAWAKPAVIWALENDVIHGLTDKTVAPRESATRAQYAAILMNIGAKTPTITYDKLTYYHNGNIITVDEENGEDANGEPIPAKGVLVGDGYILKVAYTDDDVQTIMNSLEGLKYTDYDLKGDTMIPAFVDAHSHINMVGQNFDASPSAGVTSLEALVEIGKKDFDSWVNDTSLDDKYGPNEPSGKFWFATNGFDNTAFVDADKNFGKGQYAMPTKDVLDKISTEYPIVYIHASSHMGALNSKAMELLPELVKAAGKEEMANAEVNWDKDKNGEYTGIVREGGFYVLAYIGKLWNPQGNRTPDSSSILANAMDTYAENGITSGIIGGGGKDQTKLMDGIPEEERIIDITSLVTYDNYSTLLKGGTVADSQYSTAGLKYGAVKMLLDGSPQGKTAWFAVDETDPSGGGYYRNSTETILDNKGENSWWYAEKEGKQFEDEVVVERFTQLMKDGVQFHAHANGTGAIQQFIDAYRMALVNNGVDLNDEAAIKAMQDKVRAVIIHSQTITQKQLQECKDLGINISFFTDHVYYYGDYHMFSTVGPIRGQLISPMNDALTDDEINITMHQDSPVAPPNMVFSIFNAANRITRDNQPIGRGSADGSSDNDSRITDWTNKQYDTKDERVSAYEALKCVTINSAWQNYEEDERGSITEGKQADFAILETNILGEEFLSMDPDVVQKGGFVDVTINNGKTIFVKA